MAIFLTKKYIYSEEEYGGDDYEYCIEKLKPYLQKNDMISVREFLCGIRKFDISPEVCQDVIAFLLQSLGEETYFKDSDRIFPGEFYDIDMIHIELPDNIWSIGDSAFEGCPLRRTLVIPKSVRHIGDSAFKGNNLDEIKIPEDAIKGIYSENFNDGHDVSSISKEQIYRTKKLIQMMSYLPANKMKII